MKKNIFILILFNSCFQFVLAQQTTLKENAKTNRETDSHKILIIPFEPKLYLSEIDYYINNETKLSAKQIKYLFRNGINEELYKAFKAEKFNALDLMEDTAKYKKDIDGIYQFLSYDYQKVPNQTVYKEKIKEKKEKKIQKGQLTLETNSDARFMNARITDIKTIKTIKQKFNTDIIVFINELDIKATGSKNPSELGEGNPNRKIIVHYTILSNDLKELNSGTVEEDFNSKLNIPQKIIEMHFSSVASIIVARLNKSLNPPSKNN